jgi:hypothetical protein
MDRVRTWFACLLIIGIAGSLVAKEPDAVPKVVRAARAAPSDKPASAQPRIGTTDVPFVVRTLEAPEAALERTEAAEHRAWERSSGRAALYVAGVMAAFALLQLLLFFWQLWLMRETIKDASQSARAASAAAAAADLSARAAIGIELPLITTRLFGLLRTNVATDPYDPPGGTVNDGYPSRHCSAGPFLFKNIGRSPAILERVDLGWSVAADLAEQPQYSELVALEHLSTIATGEEFQAPYHLSMDLTQEQQAEIQEERSFLWVYGALRYRDFMGDRHEERFCFSYEKRVRGHLNPFAFFKDRRLPAAYTAHKVHRSDILG